MRSFTSPRVICASGNQPVSPGASRGTAGSNGVMDAECVVVVESFWTPRRTAHARAATSRDLASMGVQTNFDLYIGGRTRRRAALRRRVRRANPSKFPFQPRRLIVVATTTKYITTRRARSTAAVTVSLKPTANAVRSARPTAAASPRGLDAAAALTNGAVGRRVAKVEDQGQTTRRAAKKARHKPTDGGSHLGRWRRGAYQSSNHDLADVEMNAEGGGWVRGAPDWLPGYQEDWGGEALGETGRQAPGHVVRAWMGLTERGEAVDAYTPPKLALCDGVELCVCATPGSKVQTTVRRVEARVCAGGSSTIGSREIKIRWLGLVRRTRVRPG